MREPGTLRHDLGHKPIEVVVGEMDRLVPPRAEGRDVAVGVVGDLLVVGRGALVRTLVVTGKRVFTSRSWPSYS